MIGACPTLRKRRAQADVAQAKGDMEAAQACHLPHGGLLVLRYLAPGLPWAQLEARLAIPFVQHCYAHGPLAQKHQCCFSHLHACVSLGFYALASWVVTFTRLAAACGQTGSLPCDIIIYEVFTCAGAPRARSSGAGMAATAAGCADGGGGGCPGAAGQRGQQR